MLVNTAGLPGHVVSNYGDAGASPVGYEEAALRSRGVDVVGADLLAPGELIRHDPPKLAAAIIRLVGAAGRRRRPADTLDAGVGRG